MKPGIYNMQIEQGSTFERVFTITETSLDLADYDSIHMQIRSIPGAAVVWDSEGTTPGGSITIENSTTIRLIIDADTTDDWRFDSARYDIELIIDGTPDQVDKLMKGQIMLDREVTK